MNITLELNTHNLTRRQMQALTVLVSDFNLSFLKEETIDVKNDVLPADLRDQTIAAAVAQDGADARVRHDWEVGEPISAGARVVDLAGNEQVAADLSPIKRADVRLKVGDVVTVRRGGAGKVSEIDDEISCDQPIWISLPDNRNSCYTRDGYYWDSREPDSDDVVTVNGRPIID